MMKDIVKIPRVLLPNADVDLKKWAVIACDQFTSQGQYWQQLKDYCGDVSALNIIFPEYYLEKGNMEERIQSINSYMQKYLSEGVFREIDGVILTERITSYGHKRTGILLALDLEQYDFTTGKLPIRATEATVKERLPVRLRIRENALLELPHVLILIDDEDKTVVERARASVTEDDLLYSTELNMKGGSVKGYLLKDPQPILDALLALGSEERMVKRYGDKTPFLFAVGDGNHSVATAKLLWERIKPSLTESEREAHPARYVLAEVGNLYDDDLVFEAIHRVIFGAGKDFIKEMSDALSGEGHVSLLYRGEMYGVSVPRVAAEAVKAVQEFIDKYIASHEGVSVDYIHGDKNLAEVAAAKDGVAIFMPVMEKSDLFPYVVKHGSLPRKTFSMGEAEEKRYYLESRVIIDNVRKE
ncbi:MAG TPA: DUF1015 domain-containing protein [Clostridiales bacterium]|nr:DUF1015 domain-containing protein [Clostridiales bacterium]